MKSCFQVCQDSTTWGFQFSDVCGTSLGVPKDFFFLTLWNAVSLNLLTLLCHLHFRIDHKKLSKYTN